MDGLGKTRIVRWGHCDIEKDFLQCNVSQISFKLFRLILSTEAEKDWSIGRMDLGTVFCQVQRKDRVMYVIRSHMANSVEAFWKIKLAAYSLADFGTLWYLYSND